MGQAVCQDEGRGAHANNLELALKTENTTVDPTRATRREAVGEAITCRFPLLKQFVQVLLPTPSVVHAMCQWIYEGEGATAKAVQTAKANPAEPQTT